MSPLQKVKEILQNNLYMTIASSKNNKPWASPVFYAYNEDYNFYWYSRKEAQHSLFIKNNSSISIVIFDSTARGEDVDGVYIQAIASEILEMNEINKALRIQAARLIEKGFMKMSEKQNYIASGEDFIDDSPLRFYVAKPLRVWKYGETKYYKGKYLDSREEVELH